MGSLCDFLHCVHGCCDCYGAIECLLRLVGGCSFEGSIAVGVGIEDT